MVADWECGTSWVVLLVFNSVGKIVEVIGSCSAVLIQVC